MAELVPAEDGAHFLGSVDADPDVKVAARLAASCAAFRPDDEDEDPMGGERTCFGCRTRRWVPGGFTCMQGLLPAVLPAPE